MLEKVGIRECKVFRSKYNDDDDLVNKINILAQDKDLCNKNK